MAFSTAVADVDNDGLPDGLEAAGGPLKDPNDQELPDLYAMGARSTHKDIFVEVNTTWAAPGTEWGSAAAPYSATQVTKTDPDGHHHLPTPEVLKRIGDRYARKPGITAHFDVGDVAAYHALGENIAQRLGGSLCIHRSRQLSRSDSVCARWRDDQGRGVSIHDAGRLSLFRVSRHRRLEIRIQPLQERAGRQ